METWKQVKFPKADRRVHFLVPAGGGRSLRVAVYVCKKASSLKGHMSDPIKTLCSQSPLNSPDHRRVSSRTSSVSHDRGACLEWAAPTKAGHYGKCHPPLAAR